tara:strand:- start:666 stop:1370 length:705 start_codon:yes stop_codon:yes gene_type:complete
VESEKIEPKAEIANNSASEAFNNALEDGANHIVAFDAAINSITNTINQMGFSEENSSTIINSFSNVFNQAISNGSSPQEALNLALADFNESYDEIKNLNKNENISDEKNQENSSEKFNLDFSYSPNTPEMNMINDAINKGMSVEEALKYVNDKMFPENVQGPPTLAEINELKSNSIKVSEDKAIESDEKELSQIEADMDAEDGNLLHETTSELDSNQNQNDNDSSSDLKDDDIS